jgi:4-hydroxy-2-oxoheptanedioate aldolase
VPAAADIEFVYLDGEHGCFDWRHRGRVPRGGASRSHRHRARAGHPSATITRFLDRGVRGIVAPHIESLADAHRVIECTYFTPSGRSFGGGRPAWPAHQ